MHGNAIKCLSELIGKPLSSTTCESLLRSTHYLDMFVRYDSTALARCRAFIVTGSFIWNYLRALLRVKLMFGITPNGRLTAFLFPQGYRAK